MKKLILGCGALAVVVAAGLAGVLVGERTLIGGERPRSAFMRIDEPGSALASAEGPALSVLDTPQDCAERLAVPAGSSAMMRQLGTLRIEALLDRQESAIERALVADLAGYRPAREPAFGSGFDAEMYWRYAPPLPPSERRLSHVHFARLEELRQRHGIAALVELGDASLLQARWGVTTYAGHLVREHGQAVVAALAVAPTAVPVGLHEVVVAIEAGVTVADFATLLDVAELEATATWHNGANLANVAAIHNRPAILRFLISQGVDAAAGTRWSVGRSMLDDIATRPRPDVDEAVALADVVRQLAAAGVRPYLPSTLSVLAQWLPEETLPALHPDASALIASLADAADALTAVNAEWTAKAKAAAALEERCAAYAGGTAGTVQGLGLAAKRRQQELLEAREKSVLAQSSLSDGQSPVDDAPISALSPDEERRYDEVVLAATDGRWDDAIAAARELGGNAEWLLLRIGLVCGAPLEALEALLALNQGVLPANAIEQLANSRREDLAEVAEALEPFGLDLNHVDALGRNAFSRLATTPLASEGVWRFAEYLASRSVAVKPSPLGLDPLDRVLMRLVEYPRVNRARIRFARFLIDHGAPVEPSHLELAKQLSLRHEDAHRRLLSVVPELAS